MLPPIRIDQRDAQRIRSTVALAITAHLNGTATLAELSAWALKFFHAINQVDDDNDDYDDSDEDDDAVTRTVDADVLAILDELLFADQPSLAPNDATLRQWVTQLTA
ncbi:MAG: hypothetical protein FJ040_02540 [Chloroflexi bacterium]|nr:hypothetical protein [Chloroflexota bacterium]